MGVLKALVVGAIAAIGVPYALRTLPGMLGRIARYGTVDTAFGQTAVPFSFPLFVAVTLFALAMFRAADA